MFTYFLFEFEIIKNYLNVFVVIIVNSKRTLFPTLIFFFLLNIKP